MTITTGVTCGWCRKIVPNDGDSLDFCDEGHQRYWQSAHPAVLASRAEVALLGVAFGATACQLGRLFKEALEPAVRAATEAVTEIARQMHAALQPAIRSRAAEPADPWARALALRQARNTGPVQHRRPPRRINPQRTRR